MRPYESHTTAALKTELTNIHKIKLLVKDMPKPENFTYLDVLNLHNHLDELERCVSAELKEREKSHG